MKIKEKNGMFGIFKVEDNQTKFLYRNDWFVFTEQTEEQRQILDLEKIAYYHSTRQQAEKTLDYYINVIEKLENIYNND